MGIMIIFALMLRMQAIMAFTARMYRWNLLFLNTRLTI